MAVKVFSAARSGSDAVDADFGLRLGAPELLLAVFSGAEVGVELVVAVAAGALMAGDVGLSAPSLGFELGSGALAEVADAGLALGGGAALPVASTRPDARQMLSASIQNAAARQNAAAQCGRRQGIIAPLALSIGIIVDHS